MTQAEKIETLAELFDTNAASLAEDQQLDTLQWDSMAMLSLIAIVRSRCNRKLTGSEIRTFKTVGDILKAMG